MRLLLHQQSLLQPEWIHVKEDLSQITKHVILLNKNLDATTDVENLVRRLQFLCYELRAQIGDGESLENKLRILNDFFFYQKNFLAVSATDTEDPPYQSLFLEKALLQKAGSSITITLIYNHLAQHIGLPLYFIDLDPKCFLKFVGDEQTIFIDLSRGGKFLSAEDLLENIRKRLKNEKLSVSKVCESLTPSQFLVNYLNSIKRHLLRSASLNELLIVQNSLLDLLPQNLSLLGERALLHYKLNLWKNSVSDLKRYFSFQPRERAPQELVRIYEEMIGHL